MPKKHREFIETLEELPSVRDHVLQSKNPELIKNYDLAIEAFSDFRSEHIILVTRYYYCDAEEAQCECLSGHDGDWGNSFHGLAFSNKLETTLQH